MRIKSRHTLASKTMLTVISVCFIISGCRIDDELTRLKKTKWAPEMIIPLVNAELSIEDILSANKPNSLVQYDVTNKIILSYEGVLASKTGSQILAFAKGRFELLGGESVLDLPIVENYIAEYIAFRSGDLLFEIEGTDIDEIGQIKIAFDGLTQAGGGLNWNFGSVAELSQPIDISGSEMFFRSTNDNTTTLSFEVEDKNGVDITSGFNLYLRFRDIAFSKIKGWFDEFSLSLSKDTISLDVFSRWKEGSIYLDDPRASIAFKNSFGIPLFASLSTFNAYENGPGSTVIPIDYSSALGDSFAILYPNSGDVEGYINSLFVLDDDNSNLASVIRLSPEMIEYELVLVADHDVQFDKAGELSDTSKVFVTTTVDLPLTGRLDGIVARDTFNVSASRPKEAKSIQKAALSIATENGLPLGVNLQCYLLDVNKQVYDSLLVSDEFLIAAEVSERGRAITPSMHKARIDLNKDQISNLSRLRYIGIKSVLETTGEGQQTISIHSNDYLGVRLSLEASYQIL